MPEESNTDVKAAKRLFRQNFGQIRKAEDTIATHERNNRSSLIKPTEKEVERLEENQRFLLRSLYEDLGKDDFITWVKNETDLTPESIQFLKE